MRVRIDYKKELQNGAVLVCDRDGNGMILPKAAGDTCRVGQVVNMISQLKVEREVALGIMRG